MNTPRWGRVSREDAIKYLLYVVEITKDGQRRDLFGLSANRDNLVILREDGVHYFAGWSELRPSQGYTVTISSTEETKKEFYNLIAQYDDRIRRLDAIK